MNAENLQASQLFPQGAGCPGTPQSVEREATEKGIPAGIIPGLVKAYGNALTLPPLEDGNRVCQGWALWRAAWLAFLSEKVEQGKLTQTRADELAEWLFLWANGHVSRTEKTLGAYRTWPQVALNALMRTSSEKEILPALGWCDVKNGELSPKAGLVTYEQAISVCNLSAKRGNLDGHYTWSATAGKWIQINIERAARDAEVSQAKVVKMLAGSEDFGDEPSASEAKPKPEVKPEVKKKGGK